MPKLVHREKVPKEAAAQILANLRDGCSVAASAEAAGIHRDTFYDWISRGEKGEDGYVAFAAEVMSARAHVENEIARILKQHMTGLSGQLTKKGEPSKRKVKPPGDLRAITWWLNRRGHDEWVEKHQVTGNGGGPIVTIDVSQMSDEDLQRVADGTYMPPASGATAKPKG